MADLLNLPAGAELDAMVAERIMGWKRDEPWGPKDLGEALGKLIGKPILGPWKVGPGALSVRFDHLWKPSTDIADAWEVVDWLAGRGIGIGVRFNAERSLANGMSLGTWTAGRLMADSADRVFSEETSETVNFLSWAHEADAPTAPLAICRCALRLADAGLPRRL